MNRSRISLPILLTITLQVIVTAHAASQSNTSTFDAKMQKIALNGIVNLQNATIKSSDAKTVCQKLATLTKNTNEIKAAAFAGDLKDPVDAYCIFHIIRWSEPDAKTHLQSVQQEHWYLYDPDDPSDQAYTINKRLMGVKDFYFFYIHINRAGGTHDIPADANKVPLVNEYRPSYDVVVTKKLSANIQHLLSLGGQYIGGATGGAQQVPVAPEKIKALFHSSDTNPDSEFGGGVVHALYHPSDIAITPSAQAVTPDVNPAATGPSPAVAMGTKLTYDNEGKYVFDFSVAIPIKKISQTQLDTTALTATPVNVDGTNAFMVVDLYLPPIDIKTNGWGWIPHPISGVAFAKQPLHKILLGGGWGPKFSELYMGVMWVDQTRVAPGSDSCKTPVAGATVASGTGNHLCPQFTIGINLPVGAVASRLGGPK